MGEYTVPQVKAFPLFLRDTLNRVERGNDERLLSRGGENVFDHLVARSAFEVRQVEPARGDICDKR